MNRIREARKALGLTGKCLAHELGVSESTVSQYENSKREPDNATLIKIADVLGVTLDYLLGRTDNPASPEPPAETKKQPAAQSSELDDALVSMLMDLSPSEVQRVLDFVEGMKAARKA